MVLLEYLKIWLDIYIYLKIILVYEKIFFFYLLWINQDVAYRFLGIENDIKFSLTRQIFEIIKIL